MSYSVTRKAILIGCPGNGNSFLHGVEEDLQNMKGFLLSNKGGRWFTNEIVTLSNPSFEKLFQVVHSTKSDYNFIYFSGHGYTSHDWKRMLALRDNRIEDLFFINDSARQLIVIDACRNYVSPGISGIPGLGEQPDHFDGLYEAREMFNNFIANSPFGRTIIHATKIGEYSYDSPSGGYFTNALLNISTSVKTTTYKPIFIHRVLEYVPHVLQNQGNSQVPEITYNEGNVSVPFAIAVPQIALQNPRRRQVLQRQYATVNNDSTDAGWLLVGLALLLLVKST